MSSIRLIMNKKEQQISVLTHFSKMLKERGIISNSDSVASKLVGMEPNNGQYNINENGKKISLIFLFTTLASIKKDSDIEQFLKKNTDHKFVICSKANKKAINQIIDFNGELFLIHELLVHLPSFHLTPKHEILNEDEKNILLKIYNINNLPKIQQTDIMIRYYGGKVGDIFKITRPTYNSGESIVFKRVIPGKD